MKQTKYQKAIKWIAYNDEPTTTNRWIIESLISVGLVADVFNKSNKEVVDEIVKIRVNKLGMIIK